MDNLPVRILFTGLPPGYCYTSPERFAADIAAAMSGFAPGEYTLPNFGPDEPDPEDRNKPWYRLNGDGTPDRWYKYANGVWSSPRPKIEMEPDYRMIWVGLESDLWSLHGGGGVDPSVVAPTATTGSFWERDTAFDFRFPLGIGTSPSVTQPSGEVTGSTTVGVGQTGGAEDTEIVLDAENVAPHSHDVTVESTTGDSADSEQGKFSVGDGTFKWRSDLSNDKVGHTREAGGNTDGDPEPIEKTNMPPYYGLIFAKSTIRQFYTV